MKKEFKIISQLIENNTRVLDVGCGDGTFLKHCYELIVSQTKRKDFLDSLQLILIGADIYKAARTSCRYTLLTNNINIP